MDPICQEHANKLSDLFVKVENISKKQDAMQVWITDNAEVTRDVRSLLTTFKVSRSVADYVTKIGGACAIVYAGYKGWFTK